MTWGGRGLEIFLTSISAHKVHTWISRERWCWLGPLWWHKHRISWPMIAAVSFYSFYLEMKSSFSLTWELEQREAGLASWKVLTWVVWPHWSSVYATCHLLLGLPLPRLPPPPPLTRLARQSNTNNKQTCRGILLLRNANNSMESFWSYPYYNLHCLDCRLLYFILIL